MAPRSSLERRTYRALLRLLPPDMRMRFGPGMEEVFGLRLAEANGSVPRRVGVWVRAIVDLVTQAVTLRSEGLEDGRWTMSALLQDARYGVRAAVAAPGFAMLVIVTLGLGIGASTATFSVVHAALFRALPFEEPDRLVFVWPEVNANKAMALMAEERMATLERVSGLSAWTLTMTGVGAPRELTGLLVDPGYFEMLGVPPLLGRAFRGGEDLPGEGGVVVLSHDFWVSDFGADPSVLGRVITLGGAEYESRQVIGVMPPGVDALWEDVDVWIPLEGERSLGLAADNTWYVNERLARLAPGATLAEANAEVRAYAAEVQALLPDHFTVEEATQATVRPLREYLSGPVSGPLWVALGAVGLVLLIGCFNVANLLLARGDRRAGDLAVRAALGAGRLRVTRMLLAEAGVLGAVGGALGVLASLGLIRVIVRLAPEDLPGVEAISLNSTVLGFAVGVTAFSVLGAGLVPAIRVGRADATSTLGGRGRGTGNRATGRLTPVLVSGQIALAVIVTVGSGLMVRSLTTLLSVDPGMDGEGVLTFKPNPPAGRYPDGDAFRTYYEQVSARVAALPGVESVGGINLLPGSRNNWSFPTHPEGFMVAEGATTPTVNFRAVRGDYFAATRIPLVSGRAVSDDDRADSQPVVVVNEAFVSTFWPGLDPLGRTVSIFSATATQHSVVGVVGDVHQHGPSVSPSPEMYFSHGQVPWDQMSMWIMVRVRSGDPLALAEMARDAVWAVDPDVPIADMAHLGEVLAQSVRSTRFLTVLLTAFGALALALCAVGVFGVATYTSTRRLPEFGVRLALGSSRGRVIRTALARSLAPVVAGLLIGTAGAALSSKALAAVLFNVGPTDPVTFVAAAMVLGAIGLLASVIPAWRASRVDPVSVLGGE